MGSTRGCASEVSEMWALGIAGRRPMDGDERAASLLKWLVRKGGSGMRLRVWPMAVATTGLLPWRGANVPRAGVALSREGGGHALSSRADCG